MTLQNAPGEREYPVRARMRHARDADIRRRATPALARRRIGVLMTVAIPIGAVAFIVALMVAPAGSGPVLPLFYFGVATAFGLALAMFVLTPLDARGPRRAQREYLAQTGIPPVTPRQQQLLALDAVSDFSFGGWNSSLAFSPTWRELPQSLRDRYADGRAGTPWGAMPMTRLDDHRSALDTQFRVASRDDIELLVADTLTKGALSQRFEEVARSENAERMISRVATITGETVFQVLDRTQVQNGEPPILLLAGDTERTIGAVRYAYLADYLSAERAWELLTQLGDRVFARFSGYDAYAEDVAVAIAFRTDSLESVQGHRDLVRALVASDWPAAHVSWPQRD